MVILVTWWEGGYWYPINSQAPPYKAIMFEDGSIWDCLLRRWRR